MSYVDDLLGAEVPSKAHESFNAMRQLLEDLNIPISESKLTPPTTNINCLGIEVDSIKATLSIPSENLKEIVTECQQFKDKKSFTRKQLQSLLGKLMFIHKVVKPARIFVNRLLQGLRSMDNKCDMTPEVSKDINWFCQLLNKFNGTCQYMYNLTPSNETIELDACLTGLGACYKDCVYHYEFKQGEVLNSLSITHLEMWNVLVALRIWGPKWASTNVKIKCDNQAVVSVINSGATKDQVLATMCRNVWLETAKNDINLILVHIPGKLNTCADLLSRWHKVHDNNVKLTRFIPYPKWYYVKAEHLCLNLEI